jgi:hypothetical protein
MDHLHSPFPYLAIAAGISPGALPNIISGFIGAIAAHIIRRLAGDEWWFENRMILGVGIATGTAIAVTLAVAISMITSALGALPF